MKISAFVLFLLVISSTYGADPPADKARGVFVSFGVGPRMPVDYFARTSDLGYGFNIELSYTDNEYLPIFLFAKVGFEQYPGSQDFYEATSYSNYATTSIPVNMGARFYFPPVVENVVLFIPFLEASAAYSYYTKLHQFKPGTGQSNYTEEISKLGLSVGAGISMFLIEVMASYSYFETNQFLSVDLKVRLPLYINY